VERAVGGRPELVEHDGPIDAAEAVVAGMRGVGRIVQQPLDLAADGQQLIHLLGHDRQADGVGAQLGIDRPAEADVDEGLAREVTTSTSWASR
jgi:hypothetical protein